MSDALAAVQGIFFSLQTNLNMMLAACKNKADRDKITDQYVIARDNYYACINKEFQDDDPALKVLVATAYSDVEALKKIDDSLGNITKVIDTITQAVTIGGQIAAKVIAV